MSSIPDNPMGTDGFEFIEYTAPDSRLLEELYFARDLDEDGFIRYGNEMLEGVAVFWDGLEEQRQELQ